jgi:hypothetical protein
MVSVNNIILKKCFDLYDDSSIYSNYTKIAFKYHKYYKENKEKKFYQEPDKLKEDVKKWLFFSILRIKNENMYGRKRIFRENIISNVFSL